MIFKDQYKQGNRKNFEPELRLKQNPPNYMPKVGDETFSDIEGSWDDYYEELSNFSKETWEVSYEENSDEENEVCFNGACAHSEEIPESRMLTNPSSWKKQIKNVRFEKSNSNCFPDALERCSGKPENENPGIVDCRHKIHRKTFGQEPPNIIDRLRCQSKWRNIEYCDKKHEKRPKSSPEKSSNFLNAGGERLPVGIEEYEGDIEPRHRRRRKEHRCFGRTPYGDADNANYMYADFTNHKSQCKFDFGDEFKVQHQGDCCDHFITDKEKRKISSGHKHVNKEFFCPMNDFLYDVATKSSKKKLCKEKQFDAMANHVKLEHCYPPGEYCSKGKKKVLEVVREKNDQLSDSTYRVPCSKLSSHTVPNELTKHVSMGPGSEKNINPSQSDWSCWTRKNSLEKIIHPTKFYKMRSRRTRMNRLKNGWKKAFVRTVREGNHNEKVGVVIMGPKGPEFYSKNKEQENEVDQAKNQITDIGPKSYEVMAVDCKNVYLTSSDPRTYTTTCNLPLPEDETKANEELENFSRNVNKIVKTSEKNFYKYLSTTTQLEKNKNLEEAYKNDKDKENSDEETKNEEEEEEDDDDDDDENDRKDENETDGKKILRKSPFQLIHLDNLAPKMPKSLKKRDKKYSEESKAMADALNKQAREYKESQGSNKDVAEGHVKALKSTPQNFPSGKINEKTAEANLSLWGMTMDHLSPKKNEEKDESEIGTSNKIDCSKENPDEITTKKEKNNQITSEPLVSPQQRTKKVSNIGELKAFVENCGGDGKTLKQSTPKQSPRRTQPTTTGQWPGLEGERNGTPDADMDPSLISEMFRDLTENGYAISQAESQNLQNIFSKANAGGCSNDETSEFFSESPPDLINGRTTRTEGNKKAIEKNEKIKDSLKMKNRENDKQERENEALENSFEESSAKKFSKLKARLDEKILKKLHNKEKTGKKLILEDRMKVLREALPGIAAENETLHLKQLKKYIESFIRRVEASTCSEFQKRKHNRSRIKDVISTDSSEVRVDARKILDFVNNPFNTISSDVTINIAKKLTDALVQEKTNKTPKNGSPKAKKLLAEDETDDERLLHCGATSSSGKSSSPSPGRIRLTVEAFLQTVNVMAIVAYGALAVCSVVLLVKKYKCK